MHDKSEIRTFYHVTVLMDYEWFCTIPAVDIRLTPRSHRCSPNDEMREDNGSFVILPLQEYFTEVSRLLFCATHYMAFLQDITIVVASHWPAGPFQATTNETFNTANIQITASGRDAPYATQLGGCGQPAWRVYFHDCQVPANFGRYRCSAGATW